MLTIIHECSCSIANSESERFLTQNSVTSEQTVFRCKRLSDISLLKVILKFYPRLWMHGRRYNSSQTQRKQLLFHMAIWNIGHPQGSRSSDHIMLQVYIKESASASQHWSLGKKRMFFHNQLYNERGCFLLICFHRIWKGQWNADRDRWHVSSMSRTSCDEFSLQTSPSCHFWCFPNSSGPKTGSIIGVKQNRSTANCNNCVKPGFQEL